MQGERNNVWSLDIQSWKPFSLKSFNFVFELYGFTQVHSCKQTAQTTHIHSLLNSDVLFRCRYGSTKYYLAMVSHFQITLCLGNLSIVTRCTSWPCKYQAHTIPSQTTSTHIPSRTLENGETQLLRAHDHLVLCLQGPAEQNEFSLFELPAAERRIEMKMMLFYVWDHFTATRSKLTGTLITI